MIEIMGNLDAKKHCRRSWTVPENELLKEWYPKIGKACANMLHGRSETACEVRAKQVFHLTYTYNPDLCEPWTSEEANMLDDCINKHMSLTETSVNLPKRSYDEIKDKITQVYGTKKSSDWSKEDIEFLINNYKKMSTVDIAIQLDRSCLAIRSKAMALGINDNHKPWTAYEDNFIRLHYGGMATYDIRQLLYEKGYDRTEEAIVMRASHLGVSTRHRFSKWEDEIIFTESERGTSPEEISEKFLPKKSPEKITARYKELVAKGMTKYD